MPGAIKINLLHKLTLLRAGSENISVHLRAATCKYHLQLYKIEKSKILKLCHTNGFWSLITEILVSVHSRKYFSVAATFPSRTLQGQANRLKIPLLYAHSLEIVKY